MVKKKQEKAVYNLFYDIYGGFFFKRENDTLIFYSRLFNEPMFEFEDGNLTFKDELLFNSMESLTDTTTEEVTDIISKYFDEKFHIKIKKILK